MFVLSQKNVHNLVHFTNFIVNVSFNIHILWFSCSQVLYFQKQIFSIKVH